MDVSLTRPWPEDVQPIAAALSDWQTARWLTAAPWPYDETDAAAFIDLAGLEEYAVRRNNRLIGMVRAGQSFGIWMAPEAQRQGLGLRASVLALSRRFARGAGMVEAFHLIENDRSAALLERLGFQRQEQVLRWSQPHGKDMPAWRLSLTAEDFAARHSISIRTERLVIDGFRPEDAEPLHRIVTTPSVARMLLLFHPDMSLAESTAILGTGALLPPMRLVVRRAGRVIGSVGVGTEDPARIYYFLAPETAGQGLGQEMASAFLDEIRARFDPPELLADVFLDNLPSRRLLKNLGFKRDEDQMLSSRARPAPAEGTVYRWRRRAVL